MTELKNIAGTWTGSYFYDLEQQRPPGDSGGGFTLQIQQAWWQSIFGWFSGSVTDDPKHGMPGAGRISGKIRGVSIGFSKQMPVSYVTHEGRSISLREFLREHGCDPGHDVRHRPILYRGTFISADSASGTWRITAGSLDISPKLRLPMRECTGTWKLTR